MIGVIIFVTDRLRRAESIMIMILMMDLCECVCVCVRVRWEMSHLTLGLSARCHLFCQCAYTRVDRKSHTHAHTMHTPNHCWENRHVNILLQEDVCVRRWTLINIRFLCNSTQIINTQTHTQKNHSHTPGRSVILALPRMLSSEGSAKGKPACCQPTGHTWDQGRVGK